MTSLGRPRRLTVCLVSHHPLVLRDLQRVFSRPGFRFKAHWLQSTGAADLRRLPLPPAAVYILDAQAPRWASQALLAAVRERFPRVRLVVVGEKFNEANSFPLLRLGAKGLLSYAELRQQLPRAVQVVAAGGFWVPRSLLSRFVDSLVTSLPGRPLLALPADLTQREREVLDAVLEKLANKEIAGKLNISERTVKFHVSKLLAKFGVQNRNDLILYFLQNRPLSL